MSENRFHKAAKDGILAYLKNASKKDTNAKDNDWMTPVLWAAFEGHLNALRLLCAKGGDPDRCDQFGNSALHLASAKGHFDCVEFLVKFGVNIYALDIDKHSAKDLAAINNREEILRYLDAAAAKQEATDKKKAKSLKEIAEKNCEKHIREYLKRQEKCETEYTDIKSHKLSTTTNSSKSTNMLYSLKQKIWSSQGNLSKHSKESTKFSDLVGSQEHRSGTALRKKSQIDSGRKSYSHAIDNTDFNNGEGGEDDGRRTISSVTGEVVYVGTFNSSNDEDNKRGKITDVFNIDHELGATCSDDNEGETQTLTLSRSFSQPDILNDADYDTHDGTFLHRPSGLFDRPMLGSIAFRRSITAALSQLKPERNMNDEDIESKTGSTATRSNSTASKTRSGSSKATRSFNISDTESDSDEDSQGVGGSPMQRFLTVWGLEEYLSVFEKQQIDLDTLMLLTEADLKSLKSLPLGPFRKLTFAIQERKNALANPGIIQDTSL